MSVWIPLTFQSDKTCIIQKPLIQWNHKKSYWMQYMQCSNLCACFSGTPTFQKHTHKLSKSRRANKILLTLTVQETFLSVRRLLMMQTVPLLRSTSKKKTASLSPIFSYTSCSCTKIKHSEALALLCLRQCYEQIQLSQLCPNAN